jgi:putative lipoic acid-binding regulatory protein
MRTMETEEQKRKRLQNQLDATHRWPCSFSFKFILPANPSSIAALKGMFSEAAQFSERPSRKGNYTAFTIVETVGSAQDVFARYEAAAAIEGIISL